MLTEVAFGVAVGAVIGSIALSWVVFVTFRNIAEVTNDHADYLEKLEGRIAELEREDCQC